MNTTIPNGAVLKITREDTLDDIEKCLMDMKAAGMNTAVIWPAIYWWEEKREGFPFNTGKQILELASKHNMKIIMELAGQLSLMEYTPDFRMKEEYLPVDINGNINYAQASFGYLNYFHPEVEALIADYLKNVANAYKDSPALYAYDIFNETLAGSYDAYTMEYFRIWLREKYKTIEHLNQVWERSFTDFSQITYVPWMWMSIMPEADFQAFQRSITPIILKKWYDILRNTDPAHLILADNVHSMAESPSFMCRDDFALHDVVDEIGMSFYPKGVRQCFPFEKRWQIFDSYYGASKRNGFYVAEMQTHTQALFNPTTAVDPWELKQWCCEAYAAGSNGLIYWMWRPFTKGLQTLGRGLVDYKGRSTSRLNTVKELSQLMGRFGILKPIQSRIAVVYDEKCDIFQQCYTKAYPVDKQIYHNSLRGAYKAMLSAGVRCDIVTMDDIMAYKAIILTNHIVLGALQAEKLRAYVEQGGVVICDGKFGIVDEESMLNSDLPGGNFNSCTGCTYVDTTPQAAVFNWDNTELSSYYAREITVQTDGLVLSSFSDGMPAVIRKDTGKGCVYTINTYYWYGYSQIGKGTDTLAEKIAEILDLKQIEITTPLQVRICENEVKYIAFVFNYTDCEINGHLNGFGFDESIFVPAHDVLIFERSKEHE